MEEGPLDNYTGQILVTDSRGTILYANKALQTRKGFLLEDIVNKKPGDLWGGHMERNFYQDMWGTLKEKKQSFSGEVFNTGAKGDSILEHIHIAPIFGKGGDIEYYLELEPSAYDNRSQEQFDHELRAVTQNQARRPEDILGLISRWMNKEGHLPQGVDRRDTASLLEFLAFKGNQSGFDEDELYIRLSKKDSLYFRKIFEKYKNKVFNYLLYRLNKNVPLAEELTQDTFNRAFLALPHFNYQKIPYLSYLLMIAHNLLVNYYKKMKPVLVEDFSSFPIQVEDSDDEHADEIELLWTGIKTLAPIEQSIFLMKYKDGLPVKAIAQKLNKSENAVKLHLSRGRKKLREHFDRLGA